MERTFTKPERLRSVLQKNSRLIALDEHGEDLTTQGFASLLKTESTFVIGGPDGLEESVKKDAALLLRLSSLTLPHALAEQQQVVAHADLRQQLAPPRAAGGQVNATLGNRDHVAHAR